MPKKKNKKAQKAKKSARDIQTPVSDRENSVDSEKAISRQRTDPQGTRIFASFNFTPNLNTLQRNLVGTTKVNNLTEGSGLIGAPLEKETSLQMQATTIQMTEQT